MDGCFSYILKLVEGIKKKKKKAFIKGCQLNPQILIVLNIK